MTMSEGHFLALVFCLMIGVAPAFWNFVEFSQTPTTTRKKVFLWVWFLFWGTPALSTLWLKGILG